MKYLYIFIGSGAGGVLRFFLTRLVHTITGSALPLGTIAVNLAGCFMIGIFSGLFETWVVPSNARLFVFIGILGGFTTFSTFELETFNLLMKTEVRYAFLNILSSTVAGLLFVATGYGMSRFLLQTVK